jgi:hypothetical protein
MTDAEGAGEAGVHDIRASYEVVPKVQQEF